MFQTRYPEAHVASWEMKRFEKGKVSGAAIKRVLKVHPGLEFIDAMTGQTFNLVEAKKEGAYSVNVRYNNDRDVAVIPVK